MWCLWSRRGWTIITWDWTCPINHVKIRLIDGEILWLHIYNINLTSNSCTFQLPSGVSMDDWKYLSDKKATNSTISAAIIRIISSLSQRLKATNNNSEEDISYASKTGRKKSVSSAPIMFDRSPITKSPYISKQSVISRLQSVDISSLRTSKWQRLYILYMDIEIYWEKNEHIPNFKPWFWRPLLV